MLDIDVRRGNKVKIDQITFTGNDNALARKLKKQMKDTKERMKFHQDFLAMLGTMSKKPIYPICWAI